MKKILKKKVIIQVRIRLRINRIKLMIVMIKLRMLIRRKIIIRKIKNWKTIKNHIINKESIIEIKI